MSSSAAKGATAVEDQQDESALLSQYLKSEIAKNNLITENLDFQKAHREERLKRKGEENKARLELYKSMTKKIKLDLEKQKKEGLVSDTESLDPEDTFRQIEEALDLSFV